MNCLNMKQLLGRCLMCLTQTETGNYLLYLFLCQSCFRGVYLPKNSPPPFKISFFPEVIFGNIYFLCFFVVEKVSKRIKKTCLFMYHFSFFSPSHQKSGEGGCNSEKKYTPVLFIKSLVQSLFFICNLI